MSSISSPFIYNEELYPLPPRVIVLIPAPWEEISEGDRILLGKILGSIKLSLSGVQVIHPGIADIKPFKILNPSVILSFGVTLLAGEAPYQLLTVDDITLIQSDSLSVLTDANKKDLWAALKKLSAN